MLKTAGLRKQYDATVALDSFDFEITPGEVVGVIGENGAGKSTLMKLLSGIVMPTSGEMYLDGSRVEPRNAREASALGIQIVHQELNLIPTLTAEDNIFLGQEIGSVVVDRNSTRTRAKELLDRAGAKFQPNVLCENLSVAEQQLVEIAKALSKDARIIIFDEPTAVLSEVESVKLFEIIENLRQDGVAVLYVSHRLPEILQICSRIIVLRDGVKVGDQPIGGLNEGMLANLMVGRELSDIFPQKHSAQETVALSVQEFSIPGICQDISFEVRSGEIVGIAGLIGSGRTETCEGIVGIRSGTGSVILGGEAYQNRSLDRAKQRGLVYVSEDRKGKGLVVDMSIEENVGLASLNELNTAAKRREATTKWIKDLKIKVGKSTLPMTSLSGGNQQKVSVARWLQTQPKVIILDEPTRGIDIGSKSEMYNLISDLAKSGLACIVISSEMPELIGLAHRVLVFRDGRIAGELVGDQISERKIMELAAGVSGAVA